MTLIFMLLFGLTNKSKAGDIAIIDVRRNITLSEQDPVYKDFYINAGVGSSLKKNMVVTAIRKINIRDASGASAVGEINVPVGQLKIIALYEKIAVAREFNLLSRDELPMLEQIGIMTGDQIDIEGAFIDKSKPKKQAAVALPTDTKEGQNASAINPSSSSAAMPSPQPVIASADRALATAPGSSQPVKPADGTSQPPAVNPPQIAPREKSLPVTKEEFKNPVVSANNPPAPELASAETLEKAAVSSNNTLHE